MARLFKLYHNNDNLKTLQEIAGFYGIVFSKTFTLKVFFEQNRRTIFNQLRDVDRQRLCKRLHKKDTELTKADLTVGMTLPCPCYLFIDRRHVTYAISADHSNFQEQTTSVLAFEDEQIQRTLQETVERYHGTQRFKPGVRVFGWFKSRYYMETLLKNRNLDLSNIYSNDNDFIDISPFIMSLSTQVGSSGGNFSLSLPHVPIYTEFNTDRGGEWETDPKTGRHKLISVNPLDTHYDKNYTKLKQIAEHYIRSSSLDEYRVGTDRKAPLYVKGDTFVQDYFEWLIQPNDLLFIAFDDMEDLEDDDKQNNNLAGHTFDMIALVDSVSLSRTSEAAIQVQVNGRDLMKLLTDDNRMYFPNSVTKGTYNIWDNNQTQRPRTGDMAGVTEVNGSINNQLQQLPNGALNIFNDAAVNGYTIDFVLKTIISHCANASITPDNLFNAWGNRRTRFSNIRPKGGKV